MRRLRKLREARGWSRARLAREAEMSASDVGKIEAGRLVPYESQARKLASALGVEISELIGKSSR